MNATPTPTYGYLLTVTGLMHYSHPGDPGTPICRPLEADEPAMGVVDAEWAAEWLSKNNHDLCANCRTVAAQQ